MFNSYLKYLQTGGEPYDQTKLNEYIKNEINEKELGVIYNKSKNSFDFTILPCKTVKIVYNTDKIDLDNAQNICLSYSRNEAKLLGKQGTNFNFIVNLNKPEQILLDLEEIKRCFIIILQI